MKDTYIKIMVETKLKEEFTQACDGRPISLVIRNLMQEYISKNKKEDN